MSDKPEIIFDPPQLTVFQKEVLMLGHLIKYNVYLLAKAVVFHAFADRLTPIAAADAAQRIMESFHLQDNAPPSEDEPKV